MDVDDYISVHLNDQVRNAEESFKRFENVDSQASISPTFYVKLLPLQVPKAQNDTADMTVFFVLSVSASVKAAHRMLMKLTPALHIFSGEIFSERENAVFRSRDELLFIQA